MNRSTLAAAGLALSACSFAPEYKRPEAGIPQEYRFTKGEEAASVADLPWWDLFKDPKLQALIREALANNQDLAVAAARVEESRAIVGIAKSDFYPQLSVEGGAAYGRPVTAYVAPNLNAGGIFNAQANVFWELDLWGRVRNSRDAAIADLLATEDGRRGIILSLVSGVAQAYLELRELDLELEIARSNTELRRSNLKLFQSRAKGGVASDLEVNRARADLDVTLSAIPETELAISIKEHEISVLLGRAPGPIERGALLTETAVPPKIPLGLPAQLLARRPDVLAAEQGVVSAGHRVGVAVADRLPTLSINAFFGLSSFGTNNFFSSDAMVGSVGGGLFAPIFQGGRLKSAEEASRARLEQSVASYKKAVQQALREVADAAAGVRKQSEIRAVRNDQVLANSAAADLAVLRYQGGVSSYLEVLDAQRTLFDAQVGLARTQRDELLSTVQLYRALGGGWQVEESKPPPAPAK